MWVVECRVFNQVTGSRVATFGNLLSGGGAIHDLDYSLARRGGCLSLGLEAMRTRQQGNAIDNGNLIQVWTSSDDEALGCRYRGIIETVKEDYDKDIIKITANGYYSQFKYIVINKYMETTDVASVVDDIWTDIKTQTYCETSANISLTSSATIGDVEFDFQSANDVIEKLAEIQGDVDYGVGPDGVFYFIDKSTVKQKQFQVGVNIQGLVVEKRSNDLVNSVFFRTRSIVSDGALMLHESDSTSITNYKQRSKVVDAPEFTDIDDAITWAESAVTATKDPVAAYKFMPVMDDESHMPHRGTVGVMGKAGVDVGTFDIEEVEYSFSGASGFRQSMSVGNHKAFFDAGSLFADIERTARIIKSSNISQGKIEHTGYDEFRQYVHQNATAAGLYNIWTTRFEEGASGKNVWLEPEASNLWGRFRNAAMRGVRHSVAASSTPAIIQTVPIPVGRILDAVRIYVYHDTYGRYLFNIDEAMQDWRNDGCSDYSKGGYILVSEGGTDEKGALAGNPELSEANRGELWLQPMNWVNEYTDNSTSRVYWNQPDNGSFQFRLDKISADGDGQVPFEAWFDYNNSGNYSIIQVARLDADNLRIHLKEYDSASTETTDYGDVANQDLILKAKIDATGGNDVLYIYDTDMTLLDTLTVERPHSAPTNKRVVIVTMWNEDSADTGHVEMKWFEYPYGGNLFYMGASRDGGDTTLSHGFDYSATPEYYDLDLSAHPDGDKHIILKLELYWPTHVMGIGFAWSGD